MPVQDGAMGDREGGKGGKATGRGRIAWGGGERGRGCGDSVVGGVAEALENKDEDDGQG